MLRRQDRFYSTIKLTGALLVIFVVLTPAYSPAQTIPQTTGIFADNPVSKLSGKINSSILADPYVKGILMTLGWNQLEPVEGTYNWTPIDTALAQAAASNKQVTLGVEAGYETPAWVYADGAQPFNFLWDKANRGPALCSVQSIPVPWDSTFLQKWETFVQALGARYNTNTTLVSMMLYGVNFQAIETSLPVSVNEAISNGTTSCTGYNYPALWQTVGYTRTNVEYALAQMQSTYQAAFPRTQLMAALNPGGFPPIDQNGNLIAGQLVDSQVPGDLLASGAVTLGPQFTAGDGALKGPSSTWPALTEYASTISTGYQTIAALGSTLPPAVTAALGVNVRWLQLYTSDILLPSNQASIIAAASVLQ